MLCTISCENPSVRLLEILFAASTVLSRSTLRPASCELIIIFQKQIRRPSYQLLNMAKKKKLKENLRHFYRGPLIRPPHIATDCELAIIYQAIANAKQASDTKLVIGLSASLRSLKQGKSLAIIYDATVSTHLANYLRFFAFKQKIPVIQASNLSKPAAKLKLKTILVISLVEVDVSSEIGSLISQIANEKGNKQDFRPPVEERKPVGKKLAS